MKKAGSLGVSEEENPSDRSGSPSRGALGGGGRCGSCGDQRVGLAQGLARSFRRIGAICLWGVQCAFGGTCVRGRCSLAESASLARSLARSARLVGASGGCV